MKTRVVVTDFHAAIRELLAAHLAREAGCEIVGIAGTGLEALDLCARLRPQVLVLSLLLPELAGPEVLRRLGTEAPGVRALVFSGTVEEALLVAGLHQRPHGFVHKSEGLRVLLEAVAAVARGATYFSPFVTALAYRRTQAASAARSRGADDDTAPAAVGDCEHLSLRERDILLLVAQGFSSKEAADRLRLAVRTVENYRARLMEKLGVHNAAELTLYALRAGLVPMRKGTLC